MFQMKIALTVAIPLVVALTAGPLSAAARPAAPAEASGPYEAKWESLEKNPVPQWYQDAKFGIFIHWGVYCVPAFGNEWYPRNMYIEKKQAKGDYFEHHLKTFGPQKTFGYKDFIPMFKAEKFDPADWAKLFKEAGARYVVPVAEHHDGFPMYDCSYTDWCAAKMGPRRDVVGDLARAIRAEGMHFGVSSHRAFNWAYYPRREDFDTVDPKTFGLYGRPQPFQYGEMPKEWPPQDKEFMDDWLGRTCELVDKYQPDLMWFDFGIGPRWVESARANPFGDYLQRFAAHYYNRGVQWGKGVAINYKHHAFTEKSAVLDIERGKLEDIREPFWQTDTSVSYTSWGYVENQQYKTVDSIVDDLVDIVAKNGCLLLNIGPRADGTLPEPERQMLREIGRWLAVNGEAIYATRPWKTCGEGPTGVPQAFKEKEQKTYTAQDVRFTTRGDVLYAILLAWPGEKATIRTLRVRPGLTVDKDAVVRMLGVEGDLKWTRDAAGLTVALPAKPPCEHAFVLRMTGVKAAEGADLSEPKPAPPSQPAKTEAKKPAKAKAKSK